MSLTFFATDNDLVTLWRSIQAMPGMRVFEQSSRPDLPNRWFGPEPVPQDAIESPASMLAAWFEPAGGQPEPEPIVFTEDTQRRTGRKGRTVLQSPALVTAWRNANQNGCLAASRLSYWTEDGARQRSVFSPSHLSAVDWQQQRSAVAKIKRAIIGSAPARMRSYAIMPDAFCRLADGDIKLWNWGEPCAFPSPLIIQRRGKAPERAIPPRP